MITIFNRKELLSTFDMQKQAELRQLLEQNGIEYCVQQRQPVTCFCRYEDKDRSFCVENGLTI